MVAVPLIPLGITGARVAAPHIANLVRQYGPRVLDALAGTGAGAYLGDKLFSRQIDTGEGIYSGPDADELEKTKKELEEIIKKGSTTPLSDEEKITGNVTTIPNIDELIGRPIGGGFIPEETFTDLIYTPIPEIEPFTILTMADKNKDTIKIAGKTYKKDQTEVRYRTTDGRSYRVVKDEFKDENEKKRVADGKFVRETLPKFLEDNPTIKERLYTPKVSGVKELEKIKEYYLNEHGIDFKSDTYKKIVSQTIGERQSKELTGKEKTPYKTAEEQFEKNIREYAKDLDIKISKPQMDRYNQDFRIAIREQNPDKATGEFYSEEDIKGATNLIIDTIMRNEDPYLADYIKDKIQRTADTKANLTTKTGVTDKRKDYKRQVQSLGHTGSIAQGDILFGEAANPERYTTESLKDNRDKETFMGEYKKALEKNDTKEMTRIENKLKKKNLRAMYVDEDGFEVYIGADPEPGKLKDGGMVGISHLTRPL